MEEKKKAIYKKWWFWAIIIILVIVIAGGSGNDDTTIVTQNNGSNESTPQQTSNKKVNVGETVQTNEIKISYISSNEYTRYDAYSRPKSGYKVIRVEFEFENISNGDVYLEGMECYADGEKCEEYYYADDYKDSTFESLSSGKKVKAVLYYEVPTTTTNAVLEYETDYWTDEKIEFIVQ